MPHAALKVLPGVDVNKTPALNEAAISSSNLIRFIPDRTMGGLVQKLGGWLKYFISPIGSYVRALWAWEDTNANAYLAIGAESSLSYILNGSQSAITPQTNTTNPAVKFITTSGSSIITIYDTGSKVGVYDTIFIKNEVSVGGLTLQGLYPCYLELDNNSYEIQATDILGNPIAATFSTLGASSAITTTGASGTGSTATLTFTGPYTFPVGSTITVSGVTPTGYNGTYVVTASTTTSVSYANATTGAQTVAGTITNWGSVPQITTTDGSSACTVTLSNHGLVAGSTFTVLVPTTIGGIAFSGNYTVESVPAPTTSTFSINAQNSASLTQYTTTAATGNGTTATITFTGSKLFTVGSLITVSGVTPTGYNGTYVVTASTVGTSTSTVSFANITTAAQTVAGKVQNAASGFINNGNAQFFYYLGLGPVPTASGYGLDGYGGSSNAQATTSTSGTGTTATIGFAGPYTFAVGSTIVVDGVTPSGYNGTFVVTASTSTSVSYASSVTGSQTNSGYVGQATGGYGTGTAPSGNTGTAITTSDWTLDNWGDTLIACPYGGLIYEWSPSLGQVIATAISQGPSANAGAFVAMPQRQIVAWGSTFTGIQDPLLIRWCDVNNYNSWIATVINQAGSYRIPKGSRIVQCIQGPQQGLIWTDLGLWSMQYVGPPYVYQFNEVGTGCGLIGRKAAASMNGIVYWMGQSQFFCLSGSGVEPIRCPIWDVVFQDLDTSNLNKIRVAPNSRFGEIAWYYPTTGNGGEISNYVKYNVILDQWDYGTLARTAWINESVLGPPIGAGTDQFIYQHETSPDADTQPMSSSFQTGYFVLTEADVKMFVDQIWPDMKWGYYGGTQGATLTFTFYATDYPGDTPTVYGPYTMTQSTEFITPRMRGRLVSIKIESDDLGSFWRLGNIRYRYQQDGRF